jgi:dTDP-4-dehydrorhamnose reductase
VLSESNDVFGTTREEASNSSPLAKFLPQEKWISGVDASNADSVKRIFDVDKFDVAINCIGLIKQRNSLVSDSEMMTINGEFPHHLAQIANRVGTRVVHISTDCVFSGSKGNYFESDTPDPVDVYGKSKLLGELIDSNNLTLRTSHVGRELTVKKSFIEWLISQKGGHVNGYSHAIYSGLTSQAIAKTLSKLLSGNSHLTGLFHVSSQPISKLEIINKINKLLDLQIAVTPDASVQINRSLNSDKFQNATNISPQTWDEMLSDFSQDQKTYE